MKSHYIVLILSLIFGCTKPKNDYVEILNFPSYSDTITYSGCEEILEKTPKADELIVFSDTVIDFHNIDSRVPLELKFNWFYKDLPKDDTTNRLLFYPNCIGISSFEIIKNKDTINKFDLVDLIHLEAFNLPYKNTHKIQKSIELLDVNLDSYLDISMVESCGRSCYNVYWIYNPTIQTFQRAHKSYNYIRPIGYECQDDKTIVYTYADWMQWYTIYHADIMQQDSLVFYQSKEFNAGYKGEKYSLLIYKNATGDTIKIDTIPK